MPMPWKYLRSEVVATVRGSRSVDEALGKLREKHGGDLTKRQLECAWTHYRQETPDLERLLAAPRGGLREAVRAIPQARIPVDEWDEPTDPGASAPNYAAAKARAAEVVGETAASIIVDSHPFRLPKETTRKKLPTPSERVIPWDWSEAPPRRMIVESDNHYCHEDPRFQAAKFEFAARRGCDALFNLGDQHDFTNLSRFDKDPAYANTMWDDVRASNERHWSVAVQIFKVIEMLEGNHDWRIYKAIMANHALFGLPGLADWHMLGVPEEVTVHAYGTHRQIGHVWGEHGDQVRGQNPTHFAMQHRGGRVNVFGHSHKPGAYIRVLRGESGKMSRREVYNLGHGQDESTCDLWAGTVKGWSHSFLYVEHYERDDGWDVNVYPIHTDRGVFSFDGVVYRG